ncbi:MAG TPA: NADH-quinone oxidoreductase subunit C [Gammaproteobacteria bacterium]|nr:NADH-quinone oxidoreductase subunit C [Gammaproteobacteria bacterium]
MTDSTQNSALSLLAERVQEALGEHLLELIEHRGQLTAIVAAAAWVDVARRLRDLPGLRFEQMIDLCGVDYAAWGVDEWTTARASNAGFSRAVREDLQDGVRPGVVSPAERGRFAVVAQLLSVQNNQRLRIRAHLPEDFPTIATLAGVWAAADWFEREAFDLFGILFDGHPDLRRILTDYGFVGHPFRKDFPLEGHVEVRYDPEQGRVVYQPVTIDNRVLVPRVIREDNRWLIDRTGASKGNRNG